MCLIANVFSHGEIGLDFVTKESKNQFLYDDMILLKELSTYNRIRCDFGTIPDEVVEELCLSHEISGGPAEADLTGSDSKSEETGELNPSVVEAPKRKLMRKKMFANFPKLTEVPYFGEKEGGNLLQHPGYADHSNDEFNTQGETMEEKLKDYAKFVRHNGYNSEKLNEISNVTAQKDTDSHAESSIAGIGISVDGNIFGGAFLSPRLTALHTAAVQMLATGFHPTLSDEVGVYLKEGVQQISVHDMTELLRWNPKMKIYQYGKEGDMNPNPVVDETDNTSVSGSSEDDSPGSTTTCESSESGNKSASPSERITEINSTPINTDEIGKKQAAASV